MEGRDCRHIQGAKSSLTEPADIAHAALRAVTGNPAAHAQCSYIGDRKCLVAWSLHYAGCAPCVCNDDSNGLHIHAPGIGPHVFAELRARGWDKNDPISVFAVLMHVTRDAAGSIAWCFDNEIALERFKELFNL